MRFFSNLTYFRITILAFFLGIFKLILSYAFNLDLFESLASLLETLDRYEVDEIFLFVLLILSGVMIDNILLAKRRQSQIEIKEHRLRVLKATMISVQDIINNFMQSILLFKAESQKENAISTESLEQLDELIKQTDERLKKLSNLQDTPEKEVGAGMMMIDYENEEESSY